MPRLSLAKLKRHLYAAADILRREGMDAATYKDFIFGLLFLKRCSDVFSEARSRIVAQKVEQGMPADDAGVRYGESPDYYDDFFVPARARWQYLQDKLSDASEPYGSVIDKALSALSEANDSLEHVLDHISFMRTQGNKRIVSDDACKDLVRHFSRYQLRNDDFQFSDLLGSAYEFLINMFAESAGKKGGDFYTPRDVIRLMVRMLKPTAGMSIYDPTCGSGGMLIISREYVEQSGGDQTNLRLCGQVNDASAWSICKLNMLLHGISGADIQHEDTLLHPLHREGGELERFDRVIANPPFSQTYTRSNMEYAERFQWGWCPPAAKKADLMFAQHMLSVCKPTGMVATVMPHGVLFRAGVEKDIRKQLLEQDVIGAIIGLPKNLFYGSPIPASILIMHPNPTGRAPNLNKPANRRGSVLVINASAEYFAARAQNYLRPEHIEKIIATYDQFADVPGFARRVAFEEIAGEENDFNIDISRYVDNSPPREMQDVRAHIVGFVPVRELAEHGSLMEALDFQPDRLFVERANEPDYRDFSPALVGRQSLRATIEGDSSVNERSDALLSCFYKWWQEHAARLAELPQRHDLNAVRAAFLESFVAALLPEGVLDRFRLQGIIATWWTQTLPEFKTLLENGFVGVMEGWIDEIADAADVNENSAPSFDPLEHKLVRKLMSDYLDDIKAAMVRIARSKGEKQAFENSNAPDDEDDEDGSRWNYGKELERRMRQIKSESRDHLRVLSRLEKAALRKRATESDRRAAATATTALEPVFRQLSAIERELKQYEDLKQRVATARAHYRELSDAFVTELRRRCSDLAPDVQQAMVIDLLSADIEAGINEAVKERREELIRFVESLWDKYRTTLGELRRTRDLTADGLQIQLGNVGYV